MNSDKTNAKQAYRPASDPEIRENQMIALAIDLAEEQLRNGTASAQVITHYLKLGSSKEKLEKERIQKEVEALEAKTEALKSVKNQEELYKGAIDAMRQYRSSIPDGEVVDDY